MIGQNDKLIAMPRSLPTISVVIPTLREAERIGDLLGALQAQELPIEYSKAEIIVVDGGSEDQTQNIVRGFRNVELIVGERGTARQRNEGAIVANGELIVWMDADCLPDTQFLHRVAKSYQRLPFAVACPWFVARESFAIRLAYLWFNVLFFLGQSWLRTGSGVCIIAPKDVWIDCGGFDPNLHLGEDVQFIRRASRFGLHRHLLIPLQTSGRRFQEKGVWRLMGFYARISPFILLGRYDKLRDVTYEAAPYAKKANRVLEEREEKP